MLEPDKAEERVETVVILAPVLLHFFLVRSLEDRFLPLRNDLVEEALEFLVLRLGILLLKFIVFLIGIGGLLLFSGLIPNPSALSLPQLLLSFTRSFRL